jgi:hypothetical protein
VLALRASWTCPTTNVTTSVKPNTSFALVGRSSNPRLQCRVCQVLAALAKEKPPKPKPIELALYRRSPPRDRAQIRNRLLHCFQPGLILRHWPPSISFMA